MLVLVLEFSKISAPILDRIARPRRNGSFGDDWPEGIVGRVAPPKRKTRVKSIIAPGHLWLTRRFAYSVPEYR